MNVLSPLFRAACVSFCLFSAPVLAAEPAPAQTQSSDVVDISAEQSLEWYQDTRLYVARGLAKAIKGDMVVQADLLTAHARDAAEAKAKEKEKNTQTGSIDRLMAEGNVQIKDPQQEVIGDKAVYDLDKKIIQITGNQLKYTTPDTLVTAKESLEFHETSNVAIARGKALASRQGSRIEGDVLSAHFTQSPKGQRQLAQIKATGHVVLVTKDGGVSRGESAVYDARSEKAVLMNQVQITRGQMQLAGDKAEVDFKSGQSRLLNSGGGRVRALLPSTDKKKEKSAP